MATLLLQAAGAFIGSSFGAVGTAIGSAAGAMFGNIIDTNLINSTRSVEGSRLTSHQAFSADEGTPIPRLYGTARLSSTVIWLTRFEEVRNTSRQGGKGGLGGGTKVTNYTYFANVAFAICEGEVAGLRRTWIDGREVDLSNYEHRFYRGTNTQQADPLIEAKQGDGNAPAYRGISYIVFERFPLENYGNRIPQFHFEVLRPIGQVERETKAITIIPGATEFGYMPTPVREFSGFGEEVFLNRANFIGDTDWAASLNELQALCPNLERVALVVPWFGSDLRAAKCLIEPKTVSSTLSTSEMWQVAGLMRRNAKQVSKIDGNAAYGGTPSDQSVIAAIKDLKNRGLKVTFYPFIMMDVAHDNGLPSPYGESEQPAYPWRGRITCDPAPMQPNSADQTNIATTQIADFLGNGNDWRYKRFIQYYADLCARAGGVDAFLIGSELRGLTQIRGANDRFPFVAALQLIAADAKAALGNQTKVTYAADWSEYFGYHPQDGSGDVFFHLDPLWADPHIDAIGIDNYMPLADRRDDGLAAIAEMGMVASGEGFDWFYANQKDRDQQLRSPISDGAYNKPWVFRYKDIENWWRNRHFERKNGVENQTSTLWVPESKPIWFTELGCPAVDKGSNQPNVFPDSKSSENALPYFSNGRSDPSEQARFLRAHFNHWAVHNQISSLDGRAMIDMDHCYLWAWDARPYPAFPLRNDLWADGENHNLGHWLNGRFGSVMLDELITHICAEYGLAQPDTRRVRGSLTGLAISNAQQLRAVLEPILQIYEVQPRERAGAIQFAMFGEREATPKVIDERVLLGNRDSQDYQRTTEQTRINEAIITISNPLNEYAPATLRAYEPDGRIARQQKFSLPIAVTPQQAQILVDDWLAQQSNLAQHISFQWPIEQNAFNLGDHIGVPLNGARHIFEIIHIDYAETQTITAVAAEPISRSQPSLGPLPTPSVNGPYAEVLNAIILDLPMLPNASSPQDNVKVAAYALPWRQVAYSDTNNAEATPSIAECPATMGVLETDLGPTQAISRLLPHHFFDVRLSSGAFESIEPMDVLNGANVLAIGSAHDGWEILQFQTAQEIDIGLWRLSNLIRGQLGTEHRAIMGHEAGTQCVLLDNCVQPLRENGALPNGPSEWMFYSLGEAFDRDKAIRGNFDGSPEASIALTPVHLTVERANNHHQWRWMRRGRMDADRWDQTEIPLGETTENYRFTLKDESGATLINQIYSAPNASLPDEMLQAQGIQTGDWLTVSIGQIGASLDQIRTRSTRFQFLPKIA